MAEIKIKTESIASPPRKPWEVEAAERRATAQAEVDRLGLTVESEFVPFSRSRNAKPTEKGGKPWLSLNWRVTLKRNGRAILGPVDYSAGSAHCPAKATKAPATYQARDRVRSDRKPWPGTTSIYRAPTPAEALGDYLEEWRAAECESGVAMEYSPFLGTEHFKPRRFKRPDGTGTETRPILPDSLDVIHSLLMDGAGALDSGGFESWADEFGFDADSRKAETIWQACLDIGLKLRGGLGEAGIEALQAAFEDW